MNRNFEKWITTFKNTLRTNDFWVDWERVFSNVKKYKKEISLLNKILNKTNIEEKFKKLANKFPSITNCIPLLIAVRSLSITTAEKTVNFTGWKNLDEICDFMRESGLFKFLQEGKIKNLNDYFTGIEVGLDSNGRKNRGGKIMSECFESFLKKLKTPYKQEVTLFEIAKQYDLNISKVVKNKRFDFVFVINGIVYGAEVNFYSAGGSKLNETAKSYIELNNELKNVKNFEFLWITDGEGWMSAKKDLQNAFNNIRHLYNINNLKNGILGKLINWKKEIYNEIDLKLEHESTKKEK
ncbi:MAG: type II restriction endonuclease [Mycoplasmataceae bacterium]|nr:type II restriction endonuclease [Mycoplasmataceae bacterium]